MIERQRNEFPLLEIGLGEADNAPVSLTEGDREAHIHIMGAPGEGKSKFLELLIRHDIDNEYGCCVIDPSSDSGTANQVLQYCVKKGYQKVVILDYEDIQEYRLIPTINPLIYKAPARVVKALVRDSLRVIFNQKDPMFTTNINKYLSAVIAALHFPIDFKDPERKGHTLYDAKYFLSKDHYQHERNQILWKLPKDDESRVFIEDAFRLEKRFGEFQSTINRLAPLFEDTTKLLFGSNKSPLSFQKLIEDKYVVIVKLDRDELGEEQQLVIGTVVINMLLRAKTRLAKKGYSKPYALYIDEVGQYATQNLAHVLRHKRHIKMRLTVAHQDMGQVSDIAAALRSSAKNKVLFYTPDFDDRAAFSRVMYWGELRQDANSALAQLKKQHAAVKIQKMDAKFVRLHDVRSPEVPKKVVDDFKRQYIYNPSLNPFYLPVGEVEEEIQNRFAVHPRAAAKASAAVSSQQAPSAALPPAAGHNAKATPPKRSAEPSQQENPPRARRSPIFDALPGGEPVLRGKGRRPARKLPEGGAPS